MSYDDQRHELSELMAPLYRTSWLVQVDRCDAHGTCTVSPSSYTHFTVNGYLMDDTRPGRVITSPIVIGDPFDHVQDIYNAPLYSEAALPTVLLMTRMVVNKILKLL